MVIWAIWHARNELVWREKSLSAAEVILLARVVLNQWRNAQQRRLGSLFVPSGSNVDLEHWVKPVMGKIKVNVDGAIFANDGKFGAAAVARDHDGRFIEAFRVLLEGFVDPAIAEVVGVKEALSWIKRHQWGRVEVETDSLVVVQAIRGYLKVNTDTSQSCSSLGMVVHDHCESVLASIVWRLEGRFDPKVTGAFALRKAMFIASFLSMIISSLS
ncbi:hypothetical protein CsatB_000057 [Cannabis sativa]